MYHCAGVSSLIASQCGTHGIEVLIPPLCVSRLSLDVFTKTVSVLHECRGTQHHDVNNGCGLSVMYGCSGQHHSGGIQLAEPLHSICQEKGANLSCLH